MVDSVIRNMQTWLGRLFVIFVDISTKATDFSTCNKVTGGIQKHKENSTGSAQTRVRGGHSPPAYESPSATWLRGGGGGDSGGRISPPYDTSTIHSMEIQGRRQKYIRREWVCGLFCRPPERGGVSALFLFLLPVPSLAEFVVLRHFSNILRPGSCDD